jgi:hypothetical protein
MAGGVALGLARFLGQEVTGLWAALALPKIHFTYMALVIFGLTALIMVLVSVVRPEPPARPDARFHWSDLKPEIAGQSWYRDYRIQAAALTVLLVTFIATFW